MTFPRVTYAVEVYWAGAAAPAGSPDDALASAAAELRKEGAHVGYVGCMSLPAEELAFYLVEAESVAVVHELLRRVGMTPERILDARTTGFRAT